MARQIRQANRISRAVSLAPAAYRRANRTLIGLAGTVLLVSVLLGAPVAADGPTPAGDPADFPRYDSIKPNIEFWTRVFAEWRLGQVAVHDLEYPAVIYDVVDLPGTIEESYSEAQRDFIDDLNDLWKDRLRDLERKVKHDEALSDDEKRWALALTTHAGSEAIRGADERLRTQRGLRERFKRGLEISYRFDERIRQILRERGMPEEIAFLPHVESSFQWRARSSAGAVGAWQFTRGTGRLYMKINAAVDERLDPLLAAEAAADYLDDAYGKLRSWPLALTGYNHGVSGMKRAQGKHGDYEQVFLNYRGKRFGFASKNFYSEFLAAADIASNPDHFFPEGHAPQPKFDNDEIQISGTTTPGRLAKAFELPLDELAELNPAWTSRAVRNGLALPEGSTVWLPRGTITRFADAGVEPDYVLHGWIDEGGQYVVQPGDTLSIVAETYGMNLRELRELNGLVRGESLIRVGQRLRLSGGGAAGVHVVIRGDNLSSIAKAYRTTIGSLRHLNGIPPNSSVIHPGQRLRVPGTATETSGVHIVRSGDTLGRIASAYRVRLHDLLRANRLSERSTIYPGQRLDIP